jgi:molybdenum cofactor biosynthesis enzyme MoaA
MPKEDDVLEGTPIPKESRDAQLGAAEALDALNQIVGLVSDGFKTYQTENTRREFLRSLRDAEVARIRASQETVRDYLDKAYTERRETHQQMFARLDAALASGDPATVQAVVGGIVDIARSSPLADVGAIIDLKRAMGDPNTVWQL